ncbi:MAG: prenyltransferase [Patescibacteria group bacterium]
MILTILKLSRPRFWLYLAGPYLIGFTAVTRSPWEMLSFSFLYPFLFFLIPANIILYGINDLFDGDTDRHNRKKRHRESRATQQNQFWYTRSIGIAAATALPLLFIMPLFATILLGIFLVLCVSYSLPPIRLKAKPFVDSASNILYAFPAFIAMYQFAGVMPPAIVLIAVFCWTSAMHLFSAIPDIEADKRAQLRTTAVVLGERTSLFTCALLWSGTAILSLFTSWLMLPALVYPAICFWLLKKRTIEVEQVYWIFPWLNAGIGFILYLLLAFR